jgi:hypothetical protein
MSGREPVLMYGPSTTRTVISSCLPYLPNTSLPAPSTAVIAVSSGITSRLRNLLTLHLSSLTRAVYRFDAFRLKLFYVT